MSLARQLDRITQTIALLAFGGLVLMALLIFYDGSARFFNAPRISGFSDYGEIIYPIVIAACFPAGLLRQNNVAVRFMGKACGPRVNALLESFAALVTLGILCGTRLATGVTDDQVRRWRTHHENHWNAAGTLVVDNHNNHAALCSGSGICNLGLDSRIYQRIRTSDKFITAG